MTDRDELRDMLYVNAVKGLGTRLQDQGASIAVDFPAPTDIHQHLPLLRLLASKCSHITEMGMRWANGSTIALLAGQPEKLVSWDIDATSVLSPRVAMLNGLRGRTVFEPRVGSTLEVEIEETDLLFVDTLHSYAQLRAELYRHGMNDQRVSKVRKYIVLHDTTTFGLKGEDGSEPGLRRAVLEFQKEQAFPLWKLVVDRQNNNGLVVLAHISVPDAEHAGLT